MRWSFGGVSMVAMHVLHAAASRPLTKTPLQYVLHGALCMMCDMRDRRTWACNPDFECAYAAGHTDGLC